MVLASLVVRRHLGDTQRPTRVMETAFHIILWLRQALARRVTRGVELVLQVLLLEANIEFSDITRHVWRAWLTLLLGGRKLLDGASRPVLLLDLLDLELELVHLSHLLLASCREGAHAAIPLEMR
jgi:hypothetical protein